MKYNKIFNLDYLSFLCIVYKIILFNPNNHKMLNRIKKNLVVITKVFIGVLLLQFFLQTFVTFRLGRDGTFWKLVWMWKEFLIVALAIFIIRFFAKRVEREKIKKMREDFPLKRFVIVF